MDVSAEGYFTRSKTLRNAIEPVMPSTVMVLPSALRVILVDMQLFLMDRVKEDTFDEILHLVTLIAFFAVVVIILHLCTRKRDGRGEVFATK